MGEAASMCGRVFASGGGAHFRVCDERQLWRGPPALPEATPRTGAPIKRSFSTKYVDLRLRLKRLELRK